MSSAGRPAAGRLAPGGAIAVSTGARVPDGADAVARREIVRLTREGIHVEAPVAVGRDIRHRLSLIHISVPPDLPSPCLPASA